MVIANIRAWTRYFQPHVNIFMMTTRALLSKEIKQNKKLLGKVKSCTWVFTIYFHATGNNSANRTNLKYTI